MSTSYLLDVNILVSILYAGHQHHLRATSWFADVMDQGNTTWLSCPTTENGAIRLLGKSSICSPPYAAAYTMTELFILQDTFPHRFIPESLSVGRDPQVDLKQMKSSGQVTDVALLALAKRNGAILATMDRRVDTAAVIDGQSSYLVIP